MTDNRLNLFCLVDGETTSKVFPVETESTKAIDDLKKLIKTGKAPRFGDVAADEFTLWRVSVPVVPEKKHSPAVLIEIESPTELGPTDDISDVFEEKPPKKTIHLTAQRPPPGIVDTLCSNQHLEHELVHCINLDIVYARILARASTPLPGHLAGDSRPGTPPCGNRHRIVSCFDAVIYSIVLIFTLEPIADFLVEFVKSRKGHLPNTSGPIRGLTRAWRRSFGKPPETRPSLLFLDLPDP